METKRICPSCQKPLPSDVPLGLCPECLIKSGFGTEPEAGGSSGFVPPPVEHLARLFPQFEIIGLIGRGGMGAVYKARQPALDRFIALKILPPNAANDPGFAERFSREARALARLNHPNIVAVHDFGQAGGLHYLAMEFVDGANLREIERSGRLNPQQALQIVPQICDALQFAHNEGVVHRDIKPENILLDKKGRVKITDFGIAKIIGALPEKIGLTGARDVMGTPHYMAPEQVERPQTVDHRADIYSLGVVFYELLTGELPLGKFAAPSHKVQMDVRLDDVVLRALEKEPERRYQQASQVKQDVQTIASTPPPAPPAAKQQVPPVSQSFQSGPESRPAQRRGDWLAVTVVVTLSLLLLSLVGAVVWWFAPAKQSRQGSASGQNGAEAETTANTPAGVRYQWKPGQSYTYLVQMEATQEDYIETVAGNVSYGVRAINGDTATLSFRSHLSPPQRRAKPGSRLPISFPSGVGRFWADSAFGGFDREIQVDSTGVVLRQTGSGQALPQALGSLESLVFETLSSNNRSTWTVEHACTVTLTEMIPLSPMSHFGREKESVLPTKEKITYKLRGGSGTTVRIEKDYELKTDEQSGGEPRLQLTGKGTITFDTAAGLPRAMEFKGTLIEKSENTTWRTPLTLTYKLLENAEKSAPPTARAAVPAENTPKELTEADLKESLLDLKSAQWGPRQSAASRLAEAKPTEPRTEVVQALVAALADSMWSVRQNAARALGVWGTTEAGEPLIKTLEDREFSVRWAAMEALAKLKEARAAAPIAQLLSSNQDAMQAAKALKELGPAAEAAVIEQLNSKDEGVRREACRVLQEIGTGKSQPALTAAASDPDPIVEMLAKEALKTIGTRQKTNQP